MTRTLKLNNVTQVFQFVVPSTLALNAKQP